MEQSQKEIRKNSPELDKILGQKFDVLDDGFIRVVDYMGNDSSIVQAARISYGSGTKQVHEDRGLIRYLMRHRHTTPFEMCELKLHLRIPMDAWRQYIRHRTASVNEYSTRYSEAINAKQKVTCWRKQSITNKQGSSDEPLTLAQQQQLSQEEQVLHEHSDAVYQTRLEYGIAREQARKDLPLSTYTEAYWKMDLHNLLHFLSLRMDSHAQEEIRAYANIIGHKIVAQWVPLTWEAFVDYRLGSTTFSKIEMECLRALVSKSVRDQSENSIHNEYLHFGKPGSTELTREGKEYLEKLKLLE